MHVPYHSLHSYYDIITTPFVRSLKSRKIEGSKDFVKVSRVLADGFFFSDKIYKHRNCL